MVDSVNLNNVRVDEDTGRVSFSGISSGIDSEAAVNSIIEAYRIPTDRLETEITDNEAKITSLEELKVLLSTLKSAAGSLSGAVSFGNDGNVFEQKEAYATTARSDGTTASAAGSLIGVTLDNTAEVGTQRFEVVQRATTFRAATNTAWVYDSQVTMGDQLAGMNAVSEIQLKASNDTVDWTGTSTTGDDSDDALVIEILAEDTLANIRDKINAANTGASASGVTASIVQTTAGYGQLVLTADEAGTAVQLNRVSGNAAQQLDLFAGAGGSVNASDPTLNAGNGGFTNIIDRAQDAIIRLDGVADPDQGYTTGWVADTGAVADGSLEIYPSDAPGQTFSIGNAGSPNSVNAYQDPSFWDGYTSDGANTFSYANSDGEGYRWKNVGGSRYIIMDVTNDGAGNQQMSFFGTTLSMSPDLLDQATFESQISNMNRRFAISIQPETTDTETDLGLEQAELEITRSTNTIDDLFQGVTLDLLMAEEGTVIELDIQRDLNSVKESIVTLTESYNEVVRFLNLQREVDASGEPVEEALLANTSILSMVESQLSQIISSVPEGSGLDFYTLRQIGVEFVTNEDQSDTLEYDTLEINESDLDTALMTEFDAVRSLFEAQITSSDARLSIINFTEDTNFSTSGIEFAIDTLNTGDTGLSGASYTYNGTTYTVAAGDMELSGKENRVIKFLSGPAEGLQMYYSGRLPTVANPGPLDVTSTVTMTNGVANQYYYDLNDLLEDETGTVTAEINALKEQNTLNEERVAEQLERLEEQRQTLLDKYNAMEAAMAELKSLEQQVAQAFGQSSSD